MNLIQWRTSQRIIELSAEPKWMGILNVTPDSFFDGGKHFALTQAIRHAESLISAGADLIDVGGESTRPYSTVVDEAEELRRVIPLIEGIRRFSSIPISVDTTKAAVATQAIAAGAEIINDISAATFDPKMIEVCRRTGAGICIMHMQGTPQTMQDNPHYENVVGEVFEYLAKRIEQLVNQGIDPNSICIDPGIGFGKTTAHNVELLQNLRKFADLKRPLLIGHSNKGFIGKIFGDMNADRLGGTIGVALAAAEQGAQIIRVHDVLTARQAWKLFKVCSPK